MDKEEMIHESLKEVMIYTKNQKGIELKELCDKAAERTNSSIIKEMCEFLQLFDNVDRVRFAFFLNALIKESIKSFAIKAKVDIPDLDNAEFILGTQDQAFIHSLSCTPCFKRLFNSLNITSRRCNKVDDLIRSYTELNSAIHESLKDIPYKKQSCRLADAKHHHRQCIKDIFKDTVLEDQLNKQFTK